MDEVAMTDAATTDDSRTPILEIEDLCISYYTRAGEIPAVIDFNLTIHAGESVGLVGESGCGKSTVAMAIMRYLGSNGGIVGGSIKFKGRDIRSMSEEELRQMSGAEVAMSYKEPRSTAHTSELPSLMPHSVAILCLTKTTS